MLAAAEHAKPVLQFVDAPMCATTTGRAWTDLRFSMVPLSLAEIVLRAIRKDDPKGSLKLLLDALDRWTAAGFIHLHTGTGEKFLMSESARQLRKPPEKGHRIRRETRSGRARMWSAIRVLKSFDLVELCNAAECHPNTAARYMRMLERAGYVRRVSARGEMGRWRLVRHTGPKNPGEVRDPLNRNCVVALVDRNTGIRHPVVNRHGQSSLFLAPGVNHGR